MSAKEKALLADKSAATRSPLRHEVRQSKAADHPSNSTTIPYEAIFSPGALTAEHVLQLQKTAGNRAVLQLLRTRQAVGPEGGPVPQGVLAAINHARGGGHALHTDVQKRMSAAMGYDFSTVRVHTGATADVLNRQLQAKAFTTGRDIFFRNGEYDPSSGSGREVIAHELTHVVQQASGRVRDSGSTVRPSDDRFEQEADALPREAVITLRHPPELADRDADKNGHTLQRMGVYMEDDNKIGMAHMAVEGKRVSMLDLVVGKELEDCKDKRLTMFGHAGKDSFGLKYPDELADDLKDAGIQDSKVERIDLIGCAASVKGEVLQGEDVRSGAWSFAERFKAEIDKIGEHYAVYTMPLPISLREMNKAGQLDSRLFQFLHTERYIFISGMPEEVKEATRDIAEKSAPKKAELRGKAIPECKAIEGSLVEELLVFLRQKQNIVVRTGEWRNLPHELVVVVEKPSL